MKFKKILISKILKPKNKIPKRYWDFVYINNFIKRYRDDIEFLELTMENDKTISEIFIQNNVIVHSINGQYQQYYSSVDGVLYSTVDYPCMNVTYVGGNSELLRCYIDINGIEPFSVSKKRVSINKSEKCLNIIQNVMKEDYNIGYNQAVDECISKFADWYGFDYENQEYYRKLKQMKR